MNVRRTLNYNNISSTTRWRKFHPGHEWTDKSPKGYIGDTDPVSEPEKCRCVYN